LLETVKTSLTKQLLIEVSPQFVDDNLINFLEQNLTKYPGNATLKFRIPDTERERDVNLYSMGKGLSINDELIQFLNENENLEVTVVTN
jgi:DNA polymerase-3 subunit alpha